MQCRVDVGFLILAFAFTVSLWSGLLLGIYLGLSEGIIGYSELYWDYIWYVFLFQILPPAISLVFSTVAFVRETKRPTGIINEFWLPLTIFGGFFFLWGAFGSVWTWGLYAKTEKFMTATYVPAAVKEYTIEAYEMVSAGFIVWLFAGILFMLSPAFRVVLRRKIASTTA